MQSRPVFCVEELHWNNKSGGVGAKVGKEEGECIQDDEGPLGCIVDCSVCSRKNNQNRGHQSEPCTSTSQAFSITNSLNSVHLLNEFSSLGVLLQISH